MRPFTFIAAAAAALAWSASALAGLPGSGYLVFKESRIGALVEVRSSGTGQLVYSGKALPQPKKGSKKHQAEECRDDAHAPIGVTWASNPRYLVNAASAPSYLDRKKTLDQIRRSHDAWRFPFHTDCKRPNPVTPTPGKKPSTPNEKYRPIYGGETSRTASLVEWLESDGVNAAAFQSLEGTICDGATACVVIDYEGTRILEADVAFERDLTRYGFLDFWTNDHTTWFDAVGGRWAVVDVATHEWGHFAGLDHVWESPTLTMYPFIHDGAETLGLGDMLGVLSIY